MWLLMASQLTKIFNHALALKHRHSLSSTRFKTWHVTLLALLPTNYNLSLRCYYLFRYFAISGGALVFCGRAATGFDGHSVASEYTALKRLYIDGGNNDKNYCRLLC